MKKLLRAAAVAALVAVPVVTLASAPIADKLMQKFDVDAATADGIAAVVEQTRADAELLRGDMQTEAEALKAARDAGDDKAIRRSIKNLRSLRDDAHDLKSATEDDILGLLSPQQQADFALMQLERHAKHRRASGIPAFDQP